MIDAKKVSEELVAPLNDFALRSWQSLPPKKGNPIYSPWSLYSAMGMALAGAKENTALEMAKTMGLATVPAEQWHKLMLGVGENFRCPGEWVTTTFTTVNGLFFQRNKKLVDEFNKLLVDAYLVEPVAVDFKGAPKAARQTINTWVAKQTQDRIPELLQENSIDQAMRLVLANAAFVKGGWAKTFPKEKTKPGQFHLSKSQNIKVPMMHVEGNARDFSYGDYGDFKAVGMNAADEMLQTVILLPDAIDGLADLEAKMDAALLNKVMQGLMLRKVNVSMPRFEGSSTWELEETLQSMGMKEAFVARKANFNGIDRGEDLLYISSILQKATVKVDEDGFEAAAATAIMMRAGGAAPPPQEPVAFVADRPFLYVIRDPNSGAILFVGRVSMPKKA